MRLIERRLLIELLHTSLTGIDTVFGIAIA